MRHHGWIAAAAIGTAAAGPARAGPLTIAPTTIEIAPQRQSAMLTITNDSDEAVDLQFRAYAWAQPAGGETLTPTDDLVISPSVVTVAPRRKQVFRILRVRTSQAGPEPSYRLRLNELPRPGVGGIAINLEFSLPVFVSAGNAAASLSWSSDGATVAISNTGTRRIRLDRLALVDASGASRDVGGTRSAYVLAGATRVIPLKAVRSPTPPMRLVGSADTGPVDVVRAPPAR